EKSSVGRNAASATERKENGRSSEVICLTHYNCHAQVSPPRAAGRLEDAMIELDLSPQIAELRSTLADIVAVVNVDRLRADIADLSEKAGAPDLWDDTANAQKVTSALSHRQAELGRITAVEQRLDDLEVLVELANEGDDAESAAEARAELGSLQKTLGDLEVQTLLSGEYDARSAIVT